MKLVPLGDICDIQSGGTPSRSEASYWGGDIPWAKISDIEAANGVLGKTEECITAKGLGAIHNKIFKAGTLLFAMYGSLGKTAFAGTDLATNQAILGITPKGEERLDQRYLKYWLASQQARFEKDARGVTQKNLSATYLRELPIPLLPFNEQNRIADILEKADAVRRKRQQAIQLADEFLRSVFLDMFGDPITNRKKWPIQKGRDVFGVLQYGTSSKSEDIQSSGSIPVLRIPNVVNGDVSLEGMKYGKFTSAEEERLQLQCGDLLFVRTNGNPDYIARCAIFQLKGKYAFASYLIRGRIADEAGFNPEFIHALVSSSSYRKFLIRETRTTAGNFNISAEGIRNLPFIQPPLELQNGYLTIRHRVYAMHKRYGESSAIADNSFQSLSQRAFRGDL